MKEIELNEQQVEFLLTTLRHDLDEVEEIGYKTGATIINQLITKLEE